MGKKNVVDEVDDKRLYIDSIVEYTECDGYQKYVYAVIDLPEPIK